VTTRYLLVTAAPYQLLIDIGRVTRVEAEALAGPDLVDLSRALGGDGARAAVSCAVAGHTVRLGVDAVAGMVALGAEAFAPLPGLVAAAAGQDIDAVTVAAVGSGHAFRLRLGE
jgi:hypothetical protein